MSMAWIVHYTATVIADGSSQSMKGMAPDEDAARRIVRDAVKRHKDGKGAYAGTQYHLSIEHDGKVIHAETNMA